MKYSNALLATLLLLSSFQALAQSSPKYQKSITGYLNSDAWLNYQQLGTFDMGHGSFGLRLTNEKGHFHELELSRLVFKNEYWSRLNQPESGYTGDYFRNTKHVAFSYEKSYLISKPVNAGRLNLYCGFGAEPFYRETAYVPSIETSTFRSNLTIGVKTYVIPRVTYQLSNKLVLDANVMTPLTGFGVESKLSSGTAPNANWESNRAVFFAPIVLPRVRVGLNIKLF